MNYPIISRRINCHLSRILPSIFIILMGISSAIAAPTASDPVSSQLPATSDTPSAAPLAPSQTDSAESVPSSDQPATLADQLQPTKQALSIANQELLSRNAKLQREVNDLQTQVNVLIYESKAQMFLFGAFTVIISLLVGMFISWLVFVRRQRW